ncbi:recombinase family protein [Edaphocola flava]|uniref:recombinase family protein n=1 Tax=Edaphocola flava TaxID=2499629 RepID=UPI00100B91D6|nr:recombinase family protein [Edaphocola flava]
MTIKSTIRYLRFSSLGQSNGSIERQELYTDQWLEHNKVRLVDTFIDKGKSAKTFDRPDFNKLQQFIKKHYKKVDYLLVDQLDRFSRNAGEAMSYVKTLQQQYGIQVVSVTEGIIFDYDTPGSFFRAGLQLLLAKEDNINRSIKVRGGIYTAKVKEGRYIYKNPPYGYNLAGAGKARHLVINETEARVVKMIFRELLNGTPKYLITEKARALGFDLTGNVAITRILQQPVYAGLHYAKKFKDHDGGLFPLNVEPIITQSEWYRVQEIITKPVKSRTIVDEHLPLRGLLKCYCGQALTGAPSRDRHGKYFYYYKCNQSKHLNLSAQKAHIQLENVLELMSLPENYLSYLKQNINAVFDRKMSADKELLKVKQRELSEEERKLESIEEKWINNQIAHDTYDRWHTNLSKTFVNLKLLYQN